MIKEAIQNFDDREDMGFTPEGIEKLHGMIDSILTQSEIAERSAFEWDTLIEEAQMDIDCDPDLPVAMMIAQEILEK